MSETAHAEGESLSVLMVPDYSSANPYQVALIDALDTYNIRGMTGTGTGLFPITKAYRASGRADVVHLHWVHRYLVSDRYPRLLAVPLACRLVLDLLFLRVYGVAIVWTVHNLRTHESPAPRVELATRHVVARLSARIVVHCPAAIERISATYRLPERMADRIDIVAHGNYEGMYPHAPEQREARSALGLEQDRPVLLYLGKIREYKNVPRLLDTFRATDLPAVLLIAGNPRTATLKERVQKRCHGDDRIRCTLRYIPDADLPRYIAAADAVVLPFEDILTSGSVILAMTYGRAVVAPALGCLPDMIGERGGVLYDPAETDSLERALREAVSAPEKLREMGDRNRQKAAELTWEHVACSMHAVYRRAG